MSHPRSETETERVLRQRGRHSYFQSKKPAPSVLHTEPMPQEELLVDTRMNYMGPKVVVVSSNNRKGQEETLGGDRSVYGLEGGSHFTGISFFPKLIKWYTLNMYSFLYVYHTSIQCFSKKKWGSHVPGWTNQKQGKFKV